MKWYRLAAEKGHGEAQLNLSLMYAMGTGVLEDRIRAYAWMNLAEANGVDVEENRGVLEIGLSEENKLEGQNLSGQLLKD